MSPLSRGFHGRRPTVDATRVPPGWSASLLARIHCWIRWLAEPLAATVLYLLIASFAAGRRRHPPRARSAPPLARDYPER